MMVPYLPWLKPSASRQAEIEKSPADELREEIDSDGDMLVDDDERYITDTDANNPDTDNDGIIDGEEYRLWTDKYKDSNKTFSIFIRDKKSKKIVSEVVENKK